MNLRMERKIKEHEAIDVSSFAKEGRYYIVPPGTAIDDMDFCNSQSSRWVWSIGRRKSDGVILASHSGDLYDNPDFECLWLR